MKKHVLVLFLIGLLFGDQALFCMKRKRPSDDDGRSPKRRKVEGTSRPNILDAIPDELFVTNILPFALGTRRRSAREMGFNVREPENREEIVIAQDLNTFALISKRFNKLLSDTQYNSIPMLARLRAFLKKHEIHTVLYGTLHLFFSAVDQGERLKKLFEVHEYGDYHVDDCQTIGPTRRPGWNNEQLLPFSYHNQLVTAKKNKFKSDSKKSGYLTSLCCEPASAGTGPNLIPLMPLNNPYAGRYQFTLQSSRPYRDEYKQRDVFEESSSFPGCVDKSFRRKIRFDRPYIVTKRYFETLIKIARKVRDEKHKFQFDQFTHHNFDSVMHHLKSIRKFIDEADDQEQQQRNQSYNIGISQKAARLLTCIIDFYHELATLDTCLRQRHLIPAICLIEHVCPNEFVLKRLRSKVVQAEKVFKSNLQDFIVGARYGSTDYIKKFGAAHKQNPQLLLTAIQHNQTDTIEYLREEIQKAGSTSQVIKQAIVSGASQGYSKSINYIFKTLKFLDKKEPAELIEFVMEIEKAMESTLDKKHLKIFYYLCQALNNKGLDGMIDSQIWRDGLIAAAQANNIDIVRFLVLQHKERIFSGSRSTTQTFLNPLLPLMIKRGCFEVVRFLYEHFPNEFEKTIKNYGIDFSFLHKGGVKSKTFQRLTLRQIKTICFILETFPDIITIERVAYLLSSAVCTSDLTLITFLCKDVRCRKILIGNPGVLNKGFEVCIANNGFEAGLYLLRSFDKKLQAKFIRRFFQKTLQKELLELSLKTFDVYYDLLSNGDIKRINIDNDLCNRAFAFYARHRYLDGIMTMTEACHGVFSDKKIHDAFKAYTEKPEDLPVIEYLSKNYFYSISLNNKIVLWALCQAIKKNLTFVFWYLVRMFNLKPELIPAKNVVFLFKTAAKHNNFLMKQFISRHPEIKKLLGMFQGVDIQPEQQMQQQVQQQLEAIQDQIKEWKEKQDSQEKKK